jgi:hypothetical protein
MSMPMERCTAQVGTFFLFRGSFQRKRSTLLLYCHCTAPACYRCLCIVKKNNYFCRLKIPYRSSKCPCLFLRFLSWALTLPNIKAKSILLFIERAMTFAPSHCKKGNGNFHCKQLMPQVQTAQHSQKYARNKILFFTVYYTSSVD